MVDIASANLSPSQPSSLDHPSLNARQDNDLLSNSAPLDMETQKSNRQTSEMKIRMRAARSCSKTGLWWTEMSNEVGGIEPYEGARGEGNGYFLYVPDLRCVYSDQTSPRRSHRLRRGAGQMRAVNGRHAWLRLRDVAEHHPQRQTLK